MALDPDWLVPQWAAPQNVRAVCTTRAGGVSQPPWNSLNLGTHVGDNTDHVMRNRAQLEMAIGAQPAFLEQVHGCDVLPLYADIPHGHKADGAVTRQPGLACTVMVADCLPVLFCDMGGKQVAAAHAGWRGLAGIGGIGILERTVATFTVPAHVEYAQQAIKIIAWLGPCIGPRAFEVGGEVRQAFVDSTQGAAECFTPLGGGKWLGNLPALARLRLQAAGVQTIYGNDGSLPWCTVGNPLRFFSHRRDRVSGRQASCIWLQ
jgi:YfiH family protein